MIDVFTQRKTTDEDSQPWRLIYAFNPVDPEAEAGRLRVRDQPEIQGGRRIPENR